MPKYSYTAIDLSGKQKSGTIDAANEVEASSKISAMGLMPMSIEEGKGGGKKRRASGGGSKKPLLSFGKAIDDEGMSMFTRQMATLIQASLPLLRSLEVMVRQEKNPRFKAVLESLADSVRSGSPFSEGLAKYPELFDRLYINMVKAGEAGGVLDVVLSRLAKFKESALRLNKKVKSAMVYPMVVISVALGIVVLLMMVVVPQFEGIFQDMLKGAPLPAPTQLLIDMSNFVQNHFLVTIIGLAVIWFGFKVFLKTEFGQRAIDGLVLKLPKISDLAAKVNISRFTRTFGTLLSSGVPILEALNITKEVVANAKYRDAISRIHDAVRDGEPISAPMEREKIFPSIVSSMVDVGEETGELSNMLNRIADNYDEDVDNAVSSITSIIEPIMIVVLALIVGYVVISLFMPIMEIIKNVK